MCRLRLMVKSGVCEALNFGSIPKAVPQRLGGQEKNKLKPSLGPGFRDLSGDFLAAKKELLK